MFTPSDLGKLIVWGGLLGIALVTIIAMAIGFKFTARKNRLWVGLLIAVAVPYSCISPLVHELKRDQQKAAEKEAEWRKRYEPAKARFDQLCQNAGEKIYRTADNVDGILLLIVGKERSKIGLWSSDLLPIPAPAMPLPMKTIFPGKTANIG